MDAVIEDEMTDAEWAAWMEECAFNSMSFGGYEVEELAALREAGEAS